MNKAKMESALTLQITRLANPTWDSMDAYPPSPKKGNQKLNKQQNIISSNYLLQTIKHFQFHDCL